MRTKFISTILLTLMVLVTLTWWTNTANAKDTGFITDGLLSYWNFEDVKDESVVDVWGDRHGEIVGDVKVVEGKFGDGLSFDGNGDYVDFDPKGLPEAKAPRTFSAWINPQGAGVRSALEWGTNAATQRCAILVLAGENIKFCGQNADVRSNGSIKLGEWNCVTETYDGSNVRIYIDGKLDKEQAMVINTTLGGQSFGRIGANVKVPIGEFMNGAIDEVSIYDRVLDEDEVKQNFDAGPLETAVNAAGKLAFTWGAIRALR